MKLYLFKNYKDDTYINTLTNETSANTFWNGKYYDFVIKGNFVKYKNDYVQINEYIVGGTPYFYINSDEFVELLKRIDEQRKTLRRI